MARGSVKNLGERKQLKNVLEEFNFGVFLHTTQKSLLWVLLFFVVSIAVALFYLRHTQQVFSSSTTLMRKVTKQTQILGVEELLQEDKSEIDIEIQLLKSKFLVSEALDTLPLRVDYYTKGRISQTAFYKNAPIEAVFVDANEQTEEVALELQTEDKLTYSLDFKIDYTDYSYKGEFGKTVKTPFFDVTISTVDDGIQAGQLYVIKRRNYSQVIDEIVAKLEVSPLNYNSNTLKITFEDTNPRKAYEIVNTLSQYFIEFDRIKKGESIQNTIAFINEQIENFGEQYFAAQDSLKKFRLETGLLNPSLQMEKNLEEIEEIEADLIKLEINQSSLNWLKEYLESDKDLAALLGIVLSDQALNFQGSVQKIVELQEERNLKLLNVTPDHPTILLINRELAELKLNLLSQIELANEKQQTERLALKENLQEAYALLYTLPDLEFDYAEIQRDNELKQAFYLGLVEKKNMYLISQAGIVSDYIVLQKAAFNDEPIAPNVLLIRMAGVAIGFLLGLALIIIRYVMHTKIATLNEVEGSCNANILGIVPKHKANLETSAVVVTENPKSLISEAFRSIRANMEFLEDKNGSKVITTTSTIPGEGKTFVGINLAAIFSLLDKKVIILDFDLRKPRIGKIFNSDSQKGISTIIIGRSTIQESIQSTGVNNLDFIPSGPVPPNPAELINKKETKDLIETLKQSYDYVFIDTPPVGLVSDALELMQNADYPLYVLRADYSERAFLENVNKLIFDNEIFNLSVIVNDFGRGASSAASRYGAYGYGYGYGYGAKYSDGYYSDHAENGEGLFRSFVERVKKLFKA